MNGKRNFPRLRIDPITLAGGIGLFLADHTGLCPALLLAVAVHEVGHLTAARALRIPVSALRLGFLGARIETGAALLSYGDEWLLAAAGPIASFAGAVAAAPFRNSSEFAARVCAVSLLLGALNLLPVETFDGGRMIQCALAKLFGADISHRVCRALSFGTLFLLWCVSVYLLLRAGSGISWLGFSASLFNRFFEEKTLVSGDEFSENFGEKARKTEQNRGKAGKLFKNFKNHNSFGDNCEK